jgi:hypothetical protein
MILCVTLQDKTFYSHTDVSLCVSPGDAHGLSVNGQGVMKFQLEPQHRDIPDAERFVFNKSTRIG